MLRRRALVALAAFAAVLGVVAPAGAATAVPKAGVAVWARPAGPLVASATNAGSYLATFTTSALAPDRYVVTLPDGATRPTRVGTSLLSGCRAASPAIGTDTAGRWTISVALSCTRTSTTFTTSFATALTRASTTSFGWQVARGSSPSFTGSLTGPRIVAAPLASVGLVASPTSLVANGTSTSTLTATPVDAFGNPVAATLSVVSSGFLKVDGTPEPATDPTVSGFSGTTATVTAGTRLGSWTGSVQAVSGSATRTSALVSIAFTRGPLATLSASLGFTSPLEADGSSTVGATITAKDAQGRTLAGQAVSASTNESGAGALSAVVDNGDGTYSTGFAVGLTPGSYTFTASSGSVSTTAGYATTALGPNTVDVAVDPTTAVPADGSSTVTATITVKDRLGRGIAGLAPTLTSSEAGASVSAVSDNGGGNYTARVTVGIVPGSYSLSASFDAVTGGTTYSTSALPPTSLAVVAAPSTGVSANGTSTVTATVTLKDSLGQGVAGKSVAITTNEPGATITSVTDNGGGSYSATITVGTTAGDYTVTGTAGALTSTAGYSTKARVVPGVLTRGEAPPFGDYWSSRDGAPILAGSKSNSFRVTFVSPAQFTGGEVTFTFPAGVGSVVGRASGGTCQFSENSIVRLSPSTDAGAVVKVVADCAVGDTISLDFTASSSTALSAGQSFQFPIQLDYFVQQTPVSVPSTSSFTVVPVGHSLAISVGPKLADPYSRAITVNVLGTDGQIDRAFQGKIEFARARCNLPGVPSNDIAFNPGWTPYQAVNGVATFTITSPDKGITPFGASTVGPTTSDVWLARTANADSLAAATQPFELGPDGGPGINLVCPTRGIF